MSPEQLVKKIKALGFIDDSVIERIEKEIANPKKKASVKGVLAYLVKKGHITSAQAKNLAKAADTPQAVQHDDLEVKSNDTPDYDTGDLTANVIEVAPVPIKQPKTPDPQATVLDMGEDVVNADATEIVAIESAMLEPTETAFPAPEIANVVPTYQDPLADPMVAAAAEPSPYDSGPVTEQPQKTLSGFTGKRDESDQWQNKWLFIGFGILGTLIIVGGLLFLATSLVSANDKFKAAMESFEKRSYKDAINRFDNFIEDYPSHEKTPIAKVVRVQTLLADTFESKNWDETVKRAENELPILEQEANDNEDVRFETIRDDLAVMLPTSALNIARRALKQPTIETMTKELDMAQRAMKLVDNPVYVPGSRRKQATLAKMLDELNNTLAQGHGLITKEADFDEALAEIQSLAAEGKTDAAFERYHELIRKYGDLQARETLRAAMLAVSQQERSLVNSVNADVSVSDQARPTAVDESIILASRNGQPIESLVGEILPVLADGSIVGIDVGDGSVKWRLFVGYQTTIQPQSLDPETILVADQAHFDLMRITAKTGDVVWRIEVGEDFSSPTIHETSTDAGPITQVVLTTVSGKLLKIDPETGATQGTAKLPQRASVNSTFSERNPYLYQPGYYSNLYVLSSDDLTCQDVFYLGHYKGSINIPPVFWNGYLLVAVNGSDTCDLHVLKPVDNGLNLQPVQLIRRVTTGPVNSPMIRFGRWMLVASDNGDMKILELNTANETSPFSALANEKFESRDGAKAFLHADGSQLWIGGKGLMRYKIQRALGQFNREQILNHGDYFLGPMKKYGDALVHTRRRSGSEHVSVSAVNAGTLKQIWRTDIGGPLAGAPIKLDNELVAITSQGDLVSVAPGTAYSDTVVKSSSIAENLLFNRVLRLDERYAVCVGPAGRADILHIDLQERKSKMLPMQKPADQSACPPIRLGNNLLVASRQGQVMKVSPTTGSIVGTPFLPPVKPGVLTNWKEPVALDDNRIVIGAGRGIFFLLDAQDQGSIRKTAELAIEKRVKSGCVAIGAMVFAATGDDASDELLAIDTSNGLTPTASFPLPAAISAGPWTAGDMVFVKLDDDQLICLDSGLNQRWSVSLPNDSFAASPTLNGENLTLTFRSGKVFTVDPSSGNVVSQFDLGQPIVHAPLIDDGKAYFSGFDGTIHVTKLPE